MSLLEFFKTIPDKRKARGKLFELEYILLFSVLAVLSGATSYVSIADWIEAKKIDLYKVFNLKWWRVPKKSCIQETFSELNKESLEKMFREYSLGLVKESKSVKSNKISRKKSNKKTNQKMTSNRPLLQIAIDGKTLRGSYDKVDDNSAINLISVFLTGQDLILAHLAVESKESEMVGVRNLLEDQKLIDSLKLKGVKVITMDALHCQKKL